MMRQGEITQEFTLLVMFFSLSLWVYSIKEHLRDVNIYKICVSSENKIILARIDLFEDYEGRDFTICLKYGGQLGERFRPSGS